ncbi:SAM-dependent methyltransferase [Mycolicibacterium palauense]|uniref:SAM-dependent methyltransferase n=1 Tax=Mycolicibacterium palauense TaxID=2034511 RepID=UPI000BFF1853|nr:SAM-dependent methyltransferase [Mycolicibacterium palauense]
MTRLPDDYFDKMYRAEEDPWRLASRWYERRKYAISVALLPRARYRHAFEPGCSIGMLTQRLAEVCDRVSAVDVAEPALAAARRRLADAGCADRVTLGRGSLDQGWPDGPFDLLVLSEVAYYLDGRLLAAVLRREIPRLAPDATVLAAHWRHRVPEYPLSGDAANAIIAATPGLTSTGSYLDEDVAIEVFSTGDGGSVAAREGLI